MNQAVLFNDDANYIASSQLITFTAMVSGMIVKCVIKTELEQNAALTHFKAHQFDYEMQAEQLIEDEAYSADGSIQLQFI